MSPNLEDIIPLAKAGKSAKEIGDLLGCSRNAILGKTFRAGVKLGELNSFDPVEAMRTRWALQPKKMRGNRPVAIQTRHRRLKDKGIVGRAYPDTFKVQAVAAVLCGKSRSKVAKAMGCSNQSISKLWMRNPALVAQATLIADRVLIELANRQNLARAEKLAREAEAVAGRTMHNAPILEALPPRERLVCIQYLTGKSLSAIGIEMGVSRERIRQLMGRAMRAGLDTGNRRHAPFMGRLSTWPPVERPKKVGALRPKKERVVRERGPDRRLKEHARPEVLEARRVHMRKVALAYHAKIKGLSYGLDPSPNPRAPPSPLPRLERWSDRHEDGPDTQPGPRQSRPRGISPSLTKQR